MRKGRVEMSELNLSMRGVWTELLKDALVLMAHLEKQTKQPHWTFGGGTVLMLRMGHRQSKDIDIFVPDPQYLGYLNPRLSDVAEEISTDYEEHAEFIKFFLEKGEIDIVVGVPLTPEPFEIASYAGRDVKFETNAEIIAKKMWHRGDQAKARDLFDLCAVANAQPSAIEVALPFFMRHGAAFLDRLEQRAELAQREYDAIDTLKPCLTFTQSMELARQIICPLLE
jgi:predicted nucleotidyltransferase component of viral defense system